jgi:hypothetical protein
LEAKELKDREAKELKDREAKDRESAKILENIRTTWFAIVLIAIAIFLVVILSLAGRGPLVIIQPKEGISVFAVAYLMAQFIERVVEPFSEIKRPKMITAPKPKENPGASKANTEAPKANTAALFGDTDRIEELRSMAKRTEKQDEELDKWDAKRAIALWGFTSFLGILLCYFTVGLFEVVGVSFQNWAVAGRTLTGHTVDSILSGMIVGGGTKPLHDLIGYIEKEKNVKGS